MPVNPFSKFLLDTFTNLQGSQTKQTDRDTFYGLDTFTNLQGSQTGAAASGDQEELDTFTNLQGSQTSSCETLNCYPLDTFTNLQGSQTECSVYIASARLDTFTNLQGSQTTSPYMSNGFRLTPLRIYKVLKLGYYCHPDRWRLTLYEFTRFSNFIHLNICKTPA